MANNALNDNPPNGSVEHITTHGSDWLWAVFAIMFLSDLIVIGWHFMIPRGQRVFHQLCAIVLTTASIAYFSMASDLGYASIATEFGYMGFEKGVYRQVWYARYIDWVVTTPALLLTLVLASGLPLSDIITLAFFDLVMIITGLIGALVESQYKWGFYVFGCVALFYIWWVLIGPARTSAGVLGNDFKKTFTTSAAILSFLWLLYPIAWGLADGGNVISPDSEMVFYGVLDVLAKPVFTLFHLYTLSKLDLTMLQLHSGKFSSSANGVGYDNEKGHSSRRFSGNQTINSSAPTGENSGSPLRFPKAKKLSQRQGKYDATPAAGTGATTRDASSPIAPTNHGVAGTTHQTEELGQPTAEPRISGATAVSH